MPSLNGALRSSADLLSRQEGIERFVWFCFQKWVVLSIYDRRRAERMYWIPLTRHRVAGRASMVQRRRLERDTPSHQESVRCHIIRT